MAEQPIIKKVIKKKGHAHHGGAWKLAYADFVTAMMAFFLLMWLLGSTTEETRKGISEYFANPYKAEENSKGKAPPPGTSGALSEIQGKQATTDLDLIAEKKEKKNLAALKEKIEKMIKDDKKLSEAKDQIKLDITPEGLRVQIIDSKNKPMFKTGSSDTEPEIRTILSALAPVMNSLPNKITVNGHTDSQPFSGSRKQYTNWELSSERANAARFALTQGGLGEDKILRVAGLSDSIHFNTKNPLDPMNRRISIVVMNKKAEQRILDEGGAKPNAAEGGKPPAEGQATPKPAEGAGEHPPEGAAAPESHDPPAAEAGAEHPPEGAAASPESHDAPAADGEHKPEAAPETPAAESDAAHQPEATPEKPAEGHEAPPADVGEAHPPETAAPPEEHGAPEPAAPAAEGEPAHQPEAAAPAESHEAPAADAEAATPPPETHAAPEQPAAEGEAKPAEEPAPEHH
jgi:chemotaxis protein MotB